MLFVAVRCLATGTRSRHRDALLQKAVLSYSGNLGGAPDGVLIGVARGPPRARNTLLSLGYTYGDNL